MSKDIDDLLRDHAHCWVARQPAPRPPVLPSRAPARGRSRIAIAAAAAVILTVAFGVAIMATRSPSSTSPAGRIDPTTREKLISLVHRIAGDQHVTQARAVRTDYRRAEAVLGDGRTAPTPRAAVWLIQAYGHFDCACKIAPGAKPPTGTVYTIISDDANRFGAFGLGTKKADLSRFGRVIQLIG